MHCLRNLSLHIRHNSLYTRSDSLTVCINRIVLRRVSVRHYYYNSNKNIDVNLHLNSLDINMYLYHDCNNNSLLHRLTLWTTRDINSDLHSLHIRNTRLYLRIYRDIIRDLSSDLIIIIGLLYRNKRNNINLDGFVLGDLLDLIIDIKRHYYFIIWTIVSMAF